MEILLNRKKMSCPVKCVNIWLVLQSLAATGARGASSPSRCWAASLCRPRAPRGRPSGGASADTTARSTWASPSTQSELWTPQIFVSTYRTS